MTMLDQNNLVIHMSGPAVMDIRNGLSQSDPLVARLDSSPGAGEGSITFDSDGRATLLLPAALTETLALGEFRYDFWATARGDLRPLLFGPVMVQDRISGSLTT